MEDSRSIQVGDPVRSFDFYSRDLEGEMACYVEGEVEGFEEMEGCDRYVIRVLKRVRGGKLTMCSMETYVYPPVNGTPTTMGRICDGVQKI